MHHQTVYGHVLISFIAAFIAVIIKNRLNIIDLPYIAIPSAQEGSIDESDSVITIEYEDTAVENEEGNKSGESQKKARELILSQDTLSLGFKPSPEQLFRTLQLYCADIWDEEIVPAIAPKQVKDFYEAFGLHIPETILRKNDSLVPVLKENDHDRCTRKRVFASTPIRTDAEIRARREATKAKQLKEMAAQQGMMVVPNEEEKVKRGPGRPKGSKNKKTLEREKLEQEKNKQTTKRGRGRPKGSKNKKASNSTQNAGTNKRGRPRGSKDKVKRKPRSSNKVTSTD